MPQADFAQVSTPAVAATNPLEFLQRLEQEGIDVSQPSVGVPEPEAIFSPIIEKPVGGKPAPDKASPVNIVTEKEPATKAPPAKEPAAKEPAAKEPAPKELLVKEPASKEPLPKESAAKAATIRAPQEKAVAEPPRGPKTEPEKAVPPKQPVIPSSPPRAEVATESAVPPANVATSIAASPAERDLEQIVFLCPNGHRLHGPVTLCGKAGQCPHCNSKFLVPSLEELTEEDLEITEVSGPEFEGQSAPLLNAEMLQSLWNMQTANSKVLLQTEDSGEIVPQQYLRNLSRGDYAVFVVGGAEKESRVIALAWKGIRRITVTGLKDIPKGDG